MLCRSLIDKGFESIEAKWLFDLNVDQIEVVVHPQSIIHSMVQFQDGAVKAQLEFPAPNRLRFSIKKQHTERKRI